MKNNYIALGLIFGTGIGISTGVATNNLAIGLSIGIGASLALGAAMKNEKRKCEERKQKL
ncbi:MAG: hypothetical protein ACPGU9_05585 [Flavobacteriaceae bacterium]